VGTPVPTDASGSDRCGGAIRPILPGHGLAVYLADDGYAQRGTMPPSCLAGVVIALRRQSPWQDEGRHATSFSRRADTSRRNSVELTSARRLALLYAQSRHDAGGGGGDRSTRQGVRIPLHRPHYDAGSDLASRDEVGGRCYRGKIYDVTTPLPKHPWSLMITYQCAATLKAEI
jgi:hypothetical protein